MKDARFSNGRIQGAALAYLLPQASGSSVGSFLPFPRCSESTRCPRSFTPENHYGYQTESTILPREFDRFLPISLRSGPGACQLALSSSFKSQGLWHHLENRDSSSSMMAVLSSRNYFPSQPPLTGRSGKLSGVKRPRPLLTAGRIRTRDQTQSRLKKYLS